MAFLNSSSKGKKKKKEKAAFFDILKTSDLNILVDPLGKIPSGGSTTFLLKNSIFAEVNQLKVNLFFWVVERLPIAPYWN